MTAIETCDLKRRVLKLRYEKFYEKWLAADYRDDRGLFCNLYEMCFEMLEAMENMENNSVWVAVDRYLEEHKKMLSRIVEFFETRERKAGQ
jgi:hypothetical protein